MRVDGDEIVDHRWATPAAALRAWEDEEMSLVFPTIKTLQQLGAFSSVAELLRHARGREVRPVVPHVVTDGEVARIVLPEDADPAA